MLAWAGGLRSRVTMPAERAPTRASGAVLCAEHGLLVAIPAIDRGEPSGEVERVVLEVPLVGRGDARAVVPAVGCIPPRRVRAPAVIAAAFADRQLPLWPQEGDEVVRDIEAEVGPDRLEPPHLDLHPLQVLPDIRALV